MGGIGAYMTEHLFELAKSIGVGAVVVMDGTEVERT